MNYSRPCLALLHRDLALAWRGRSAILNPLMFFSLVVLLFSMGLGVNSFSLQAMAPAIIWVAILLATLLSMDCLFRSDYEDGTLEQLLISGYPLILFILTKLFTHWLVTQLPLILIASLFAVFLNLPEYAFTTLIQTLLIGTAILTVIGAAGVGLSLSFPQGGLLLAILVLPFYVPVLIFASSALEQAIAGLPITAQIDFLLAMLFFSLAVVPLPTAAALKMSIS